jgi:hypothetical protein
MKDSKFTGNEKVSIDIITRAHDSLYSESPLNRLSKIPTPWKTVLAALCRRIGATGKYCWYSELEYELTAGRLLHRFIFDKVMAILYWLRGLVIITIKLNKRHKDTRVDKSISINSHVAEAFIELSVSIDQITYALGDESIPYTL